MSRRRIVTLGRFVAEFGKAYIYTLCDSRTGLVVYVGCTTKPWQREMAHWYAKPGSPVGDWMAELRAAGAHPVFTIVAETVAIAHQRVEREVIEQYLRDGVQLLNIRPGVGRMARFQSTLAVA